MCVVLLVTTLPDAALAPTRPRARVSVLAPGSDAKVVLTLTPLSSITLTEQPLKKPATLSTLSTVAPTAAAEVRVVKVGPRKTVGASGRGSGTAWRSITPQTKSCA